MIRVLTYGAALFACGLMSVAVFAQVKKTTPAPTAPPSLAPLAQELKRLHLREAVVVPFGGVFDAVPRWSPKANRIAFKVHGGKWMTVDLDHVHLTPDKWHEVGIVDTKASYTEVKEKDIKEFVPLDKPKWVDKLTLKNGTTVELNDHGPDAIALIVQPKGQKAEKWHIGLSNSYMLAPSPDQKFVAYLSEFHGIVLLASPQQ